MISVSEIYDTFIHKMPYNADELDFAYAVEDTMIRYNIDEDDVRSIINHFEEVTFSD